MESEETRKKLLKHVRTPPPVLSLSGSDPNGGAGIETDLKTFHQHGVYGMAIPTLLTVQNTAGVYKVKFLDPDFLEEQWNAIFADLKPRAIKMGAMGSRKMVLRIAKLLSQKNAKGIPIVVDPVMGSTSGMPLLEPKAISILINRIFPLCRVITPNTHEFSKLCGKEVNADNAAELLKIFGKDKPYAILLKGGHFNGSESIDLLWHQGRITRFKSPRLPQSAHGTGCVLASSIAANLALGQSIPTACRNAKGFVHEALTSAPKLGKGQRVLNLWV